MLNFQKDPNGICLRRFSWISCQTRETKTTQELKSVEPWLWAWTYCSWLKSHGFPTPSLTVSSAATAGHGSTMSDMSPGPSKNHTAICVVFRLVSTTCFTSNKCGCVKIRVWIDPRWSVWISLDCLCFVMDQGYGSAHSFRLWSVL